VDWREREAAARLRECCAALAARGTNVVGEATGRGAAGIADWQHYPEGEVYDPASHVQYFYHRHPTPAPSAAPGRIEHGPREHGHFHVFLRGEGIPAGVTPLLLPDVAVANAPLPRQSAPLKRGSRDEVCHLVAIAVDAEGEPFRLFTTNRWVTGETWYRAEDVVALLDRVRLGEADASAPTGPRVNRWVEALVRLFRPEIATLLRGRDKRVMDWRWRWPRSNVFEDARLEVTSSIAIDLEARLAAAEGSAAEPAAVSARRNPGRLPPMAEGWGA
jgi:hypothetical protein